MNFLKFVIITTFFFISLHTPASAQIEWVGGFPGQETSWDQPRNWNPQRVPTSEDIVRIPDCSTTGDFYPEITSVTEAVWTIIIEGNAELTVTKSGSLRVDAGYVPSYGLYLAGRLNNQGTIVLANTSGAPVTGRTENLESSGSLWLIDDADQQLRAYQATKPNSEIEQHTP